MASTLADSTLVTINASNGYELKMFKGMLCAHSSVLRAALESTMIEGSSSCVQMPDVHQQILEDFALCLCSGGLPCDLITGWERVADLLLIADKYLSVAISVANVARLFKLSDQYGLLNLRRALMYFVMSDDKRFQAVRNSDEYSQFSADLLRDIVAHHAVHDKSRWKRDPPLLQWKDATMEFESDTDWQRLTSDDLRRACFERTLATTGTAAELVSRLQNANEPEQAQTIDEGSGSAAKRPRLA
eukprot:gnl/MRDRNA2_/MRDRNA2_57693_c0_seq4.p1 gnl/MRDRNA2_/MRDRNA2_57693_c0~~gnl/MRDRNA2_/MRDRNA2_57693_c0_seq4.p1  ORF type:complete len:245 (+),score=48.72 gnl/MRDRNA2_/MRDRNA2_57693_c0_seq4:46-780(+)